MIKKINIRKLLLFIFGTIIIGNLFVLFVGNNYEMLVKPKLNPPGYLFPIVWTILYVLMAISLYIISESDGNKKKAYILYLYQLIVNSLWTLIFFGFNLYLLAFLWLILLIVLVVLMIKEFYSIKKIAGYLNIPYLLWILFAAYLNLAIYLLN